MDPPESPAQDPRRGRLGGRSVLLFVILTAQLMVVLDTTIVNVALPHIQQDLGFSTSALSWVLNAYILTFGGFLLLGARAGDLFGRRRVFLTGIAIFTLSSLVGGLAFSGWALLVARAVQGFGAALAAPSALSLLTVSFPEGPPRMRAIALYTTMSAAGGATGLVAGGLLTQLVSWRWVMFVNVPIGIAVWVLGRRVLVETERRRGHFDVIGALTCTAGVTGIVLGLVEAGSRGFTSPAAFVPLVAGVAVVGAFLHHESRASEPILPLQLLTNRTRSSANAARGLLYAGFYGCFYFLAQFLQDVQGYSPLRAGLAFVPMPASVFLSSQFTSRVLMRRLPEKAVMMIGTLVTTAGLLLATRVGAETTYLQIVPALVLIGAGCGTTFVALTSASLHEVPSDMAGAASGLVNVSQQLGAAVGLAVLVSAFNAFAGRSQRDLASRAAHLGVVHPLDAVLGVAALFTLASFVAVVAGVRRTPGPEEPARFEADDTLDVDADGSWAFEDTKAYSAESYDAVVLGAAPYETPTYDTVAYESGDRAPSVAVLRHLAPSSGRAA
jgi:EmrB/QacA subfamily drug resistance transporter